MKLRIQPIQRGVDVALLAVAVIMAALAQTHAAKVEAQHGKTEGRKDLHGVVDNFIVHGTAACRVWMTDQRRVRRMWTARVEHRFEPTGGTVEVIQ